MAFATAKIWKTCLCNIFTTTCDHLYSVMSERESVIDFTVPYYDLVGITIMMKKPKVCKNIRISSTFSCTLVEIGQIYCSLLTIHYSLFTLQPWHNPLDMQVPTSLFKFLSVLEESVWGCILVCHQHIFAFFVWFCTCITQFLLINDIHVLFNVISSCQT